jgi:hypothetical protein
MRYVVAAYAVALGALALYWLRVQAARRALLARGESPPEPGTRP